MTDFDRPRRWVHLPVEVKSRGLQSRVLLACAAAERGFGAVVGVKHRVASMASVLPRGVYVEKSIQRPGLEGFRTRVALGHVECCLDEEGVVYIDDEDYTAGRLDHETLEVMERFYAWGDDQAAVVSRFHPAITRRLEVTGNPRVDLWRPELRGIYHQPASSITAAHGRFVLVTTAFAMANNERGERYFLDVLAGNGRLGTEGGRAQAEGYVEYSRQLLELMRTAVLALARARPEHTVVVRPHPSERLEPWEELSALAPNVRVVREGALTPWLLAADVVIHNNSTSGLEAVLVGRPTVAFTPVTDPRFDQNLPNAVSATAPDLPALLDYVDAATTGRAPAIDLDARRSIDGHITALDGRFACDRLVDSFAQLDTPKLPLASSPWRAVRSATAIAPQRLARAWARRRDAVPGAPSASEEASVRGSKFPGSSRAEVVDFVERLQVVSGRFSGVIVAEVADDVYALVDPGAEPC